MVRYARRSLPAPDEAESGGNGDDVPEGSDDSGRADDFALVY
jgi:hypothetical protein